MASIGPIVSLLVDSILLRRFQTKSVQVVAMLGARSACEVFRATLAQHAGALGRCVPDLSNMEVPAGVEAHEGAPHIVRVS